MLDDALHITADVGLPARWEEFRKPISAEFLDAALQASGVATLRRRRLPAEQVIWIVIGMALFRDRSIERVVESLDLALPGQKTPAKSGISQARARLGDDAMAELFAITGRHWALESAAANRWRGLSVFAYDGTTLATPDSEENRKEFGGQTNGSASPSGYPALRAVALLALRSHVLMTLKVGSYNTGEATLAEELWNELPDSSLTIVDRGLMITNHLISLERSGTNRHWISRPRRRETKWKVVKSLGEGDELVELTVPDEARRKNPTLPSKWLVRAIQYKAKENERVVLTSLVEPEQYPAAEVVAMYRERWDQELAYDEVKTHLLNREETVRSKTPSGVRQELYGIGLAYNLIRLEMERTAKELDVAPTRISFVAALMLVRDEWLWCSNSTPGAIPKQLARMRERLKTYVLPERRPERSYPRRVKVRKFPRPSTRSPK